MSAKPTQQVYEELQKAYEFFNQELFEGRLPACVITLQRQHDTYGYFSANQFQSRQGGEQAHEIALNPSYFAVRSIQETLSVLVREMVSLDQTLNTKRSKLPRRRYRNTEWADMCEEVGLMPSSTGLPGGRRVGDNVQTYVIEGGRFDVACTRLVDEAFTLSWVDRFPPKTLPTERLEAGQGETVAEVFEQAPAMPDFSMSALACDAYPGAAEVDAQMLADVAAIPSDNPGAALIEGDSPAPATEDSLLESPISITAPALAVPDKSKPAPPPMKQFERVEVHQLQQQGIEPREQPKNASKTPFQCASCGAKAWGKPSLQIGCYGAPDAPHDVLMMAAIRKDEKSPVSI